MSGREHWDEIYAIRDHEALGWYEPVPSTLPVLLRAAGGSNASIVDVGAGTSTLVDHLLDDGFDDITWLDISEQALEATRRRLGGRADSVAFVLADVRTFVPTRRWDVWHDRAVFHFLTTSDDRWAYLATLDAALAPDGRVVIATFAADGPERCAGLPVERYDRDSLAAAFAPVLDVVSCERSPTTGGGDQRPYVICRFRRTAAADPSKPSANGSIVDV